VRRSGPPLLDVAHLPDVAGGREGFDERINLHEAVQRYERTLLNAALERCGGVQTKAAVLLGLKVSTLNSKLASHCIDARAFKARRSA
jgi:DNA-binding NtrC family response regulator